MTHVVTVTGEMPAENLGVTLPHEHLLFDFTSRIDRDADRSAIEQRRLHEPVELETLWWMQDYPQPESISLDNMRLGDVETAVSEVRRFADLGGETIVEVSGFGMSRDPIGLQRIANRTGVNVIAGTGYYLPPTYPDDMDDKTAEDIAAEIVNEIENGIDETMVCPGVIGEIGATHGYESHPNEQKSFRGAAYAQQETNYPITIHPPYFYQEAHEILDTLEDAGADLDNVIMGHLDGTVRDENVLEYHRSLGDRGVFLEFDVFGRAGYRPSFQASWPLDEDRIEHIFSLKETLGEKILLSQDICQKVHLTAYGGFGYDFILRDIVPRLRTHGFDESEIRRLLVDNPKNALCIE